MLKSISFKKLAVLSAGIAIVLSSCGLQNEASESSDESSSESAGTETAAGKTKNFALTFDGTCWDDLPALLAAHQADHDTLNMAWSVYITANPGGSWDDFLAQKPYNDYFLSTMTGDDIWGEFIAAVDDGVPCPSVALAAEGEELAGHSEGPHCVKPDVKQKLIDGYTEQLARPVGGEVTDEYIAKMQKGLDASKAICTN
jgi:hypothetical protein